MPRVPGYLVRGYIYILDVYVELIGISLGNYSVGWLEICKCFTASEGKSKKSKKKKHEFFGSAAVGEVGRHSKKSKNIIEKTYRNDYGNVSSRKPGL